MRARRGRGPSAAGRAPPPARSRRPALLLLPQPVGAEAPALLAAGGSYSPGYARRLA